MTDERLNELLLQLDKELNEANTELIKIADGGLEGEEVTKEIEYWTTEISRITAQMEALLQLL